MNRNLTTAKKTVQSEVWITAKPLLAKLVKWTVWFILALDILAAVLYIIGSYQKAPDESQITLVRTCLILSMLMIISSVYGIILDLFYLITKRKPAYLAGILGYILIIALGAVLALGAAFIIGAVKGNLQV